MDKLPPIPSPPGTAFREFRINVLPFLTFGAVLALTVLTWRQYVGPGALVGEAYATRSVVASTLPARIAKLKVGLLDRVVAGQPIAEVVPADPRQLEGQASLTRARLELVRANIDPRLRKENNVINYTQLRLNWLNARAGLAAERAQLMFWENEIERIRQLAKVPNSAPLVSVSTLEAAEAQAKAIRGQVAEHGALVREIGTALEHFDPEEKRLDADLVSSIQAAIAVEQRALDSIEGRLNPVVLVAPIDGFVSSVGHNAGETVLAGDPIVVISAAKTDHIVAYVRQPIRLDVRPGMNVEVRARSLNRGVGMGKVISVGSQLEPILPELLPAKVSGSSSTVEYGQPVLVSMPPGLQVMPGEIVDLRPMPDTP